MAKGDITFSKKLGKLSFAKFKKEFKPFEGVYKGTVEEAYKSCGGKLPKDDSK